MLLALDIGERRPVILDEFRALYKQRYGAQWEWTPKHLYGVEYVWIIEAVERLLGPINNKRMLDAGGGASALSAYFAMRGAEVTVADRKPEPFTGHHPDGRPIPPIEALAADLTALPQLEPFDAIVSCSAIEHNEWSKILTIMRSLLLRLKPGAPLIVTVPATYKRQYYAAGGYWPVPYRHFPECYLFDRDALLELAGSMIDLAQLDTVMLSADDYRVEASRLYAEMRSTPVMTQTPYLSAGFVFRRRH